MTDIPKALFISSLSEKNGLKEFQALPAIWDFIYISEN